MRLPFFGPKIHIEKLMVHDSGLCDIHLVKITVGKVVVHGSIMEDMSFRISKAKNAEEQGYAAKHLFNLGDKKMRKLFQKRTLSRMVLA